MSKKAYTLATAIIGAVSAAASAIVTYVQPTYATAIVASIGIADTAIVEILNQFVKTEA